VVGFNLTTFEILPDPEAVTLPRKWTLVP
jgi:hypothetical protein